MFFPWLPFIGAGEAGAPPTEYPGGYLYRASMRVSGPALGGTVTETNVPLRFYETHLDLRSVANGGLVENASGWDMVFFTQGGQRLSHDLEEYDPVTGFAAGYILLPTLNPAANLDLWWYIGKPTIEAAETNSAGVYAPWCYAAWRMPDGVDLTGRGYNLTMSGTVSSGDILGMPTAEFDIGTDYANRDNPVWFDGASQWTILLWVNPNSDGVLMRYGGPTPGSARHTIWRSSGAWEFGFKMGGENPIINGPANSASSGGAMHMGFVVPAAPRMPRMVRDGVELTGLTLSGNLAAAGSTIDIQNGDAFRLGANPGSNPTAIQGPRTRLIHANRALSTELIRFIYRSEKDPRSCYGLGDNEEPAGPRTPLLAPIYTSCEAGNTVQIPIAPYGSSPSSADLTPSVAESPSQGTVTSGDDFWTYQADSDATGYDRFLARITAAAKQASAAVTIQITPGDGGPGEPVTDYAYNLFLTNNRIVPNGSGGDLWPSTWAANGNIYTTFGDGPSTNSVSLGLARFTGSDVATIALSFLVGGPNFSVADHFSPVGGFSDDGTQLLAKCTSLIAYGTDLYLWLADDDGNRGWDNTRLAKIAIGSIGSGPSVPAWGVGQDHTWKTVNPVFLQCGQDFGWAFDSYVYAFPQNYAPVTNVGDSPSHDPGNFYLMRCLRTDDWQVQANWEWWTGGSDSSPTWGAYASRAVRIPVGRSDWRGSAHFITTPIDRCIFRIGRTTGGESFGGGSQSKFQTFIAQRPWHAWTSIANEQYLASGIAADLAQVSAIPSTIIIKTNGSVEWVDTTWGGTDTDGLGGPSVASDKCIVTRSTLTPAVIVDPPEPPTTTGDLWDPLPLSSISSARKINVSVSGTHSGAAGTNFLLTTNLSNTTITVSGAGTKENPIVFRGNVDSSNRTLLRRLTNCTIKLAGPYCCLAYVDMSNCSIEYNANNCSVARCAYSNREGSLSEHFLGQNNDAKLSSFHFNDVGNYLGPINAVVTFGDQTIGANGSFNISHNVFENWTKAPADSYSGATYMFWTGTDYRGADDVYDFRFHHNLVLNCNVGSGGDIFEFKSDSPKVYQNTFEECSSGIRMRTGENGEFIDNLFWDCSSGCDITIRGEHHKILNNQWRTSAGVSSGGVIKMYGGNLHWDWAIAVDQRISGGGANMYASGYCQIGGNHATVKAEWSLSESRHHIYPATGHNVGPTTGSSRNRTVDLSGPWDKMTRTTVAGADYDKVLVRFSRATHGMRHPRIV